MTQRPKLILKTPTCLYFRLVLLFVISNGLWVVGSGKRAISTSSSTGSCMGGEWRQCLLISSIPGRVSIGIAISDTVTGGINGERIFPKVYRYSSIPDCLSGIPDYYFTVNREIWHNCERNIGMNCIPVWTEWRF